MAYVVSCLFQIMMKQYHNVLLFKGNNWIKWSTNLDQKLLKMVRSVSEDRVYNSIEFNEFLMMMSNQEKEEINMECLMEAFK